MFAANQQQLGLVFLTCPRCTASSALPAGLLCVRQDACNKFALPHVLLLFFVGAPHSKFITTRLLVLTTYFCCLLPVCQLPDIDQAAPSRAHNTQHTQQRERERLHESLLCAWPACKLAYRARNLANRRSLHFASCCCGMRRRHRRIRIRIRIRIGIPSRSHATASDHCVGS